MFTSSSDRIPIFNRPFLSSVLVFFILLFTVRTCVSLDLYIGTGNTDSFSYFAGKALCSTIKNYEVDLTCKLIPSAESTDTLTNLQNGSLDMALVSSKTIYDAFNSLGFFQYITMDYNDLRLLMPLYREPISLIVHKDAEITTLDDLAGKRVNAGALNSLENQIFKELMSAKKWLESDFSLYQNLASSNAQDFLALKSGSVQAMLHLGMHPDWKLLHLLNQNNFTLVALDDSEIQQIVLANSGYCRCEIPGDIYPRLENHKRTLSMETLFISSADMEEDTVELVLTAISEKKGQLQHAHPSLLQQRIEISTLNNSYLPPHPSAMLFFQSNLHKYD